MTRCRARRSPTSSSFTPLLDRRFAARLQQCRVWVNGEPVEADSPVGDADELAVLPPVSGG